ncbi:MAG: PIN domain-containing protein [Verrucomicrobia bacterium]|nr:PIN domain-containing protein [Verrucomicrobiota bacterium]
MARTVLVDSGFIVALLSRDDAHCQWAVAQAPQLGHPWVTCEAVLSESFHLLGKPGQPKLAALLQRGVVTPGFDLGDELQPVLDLMDKYANVPMSLADACLVRMTETLADPLVITTDADFRVYRRHSRQVIPCLMP